MVGGDHALTVKSVKYEVSCWLNVDKRFSVSLRLSFIDQDEAKVRRKSKRRKKNTRPTISSRHLDLMLCKSRIHYIWPK